MKMIPAALSAALAGDLDNALVASTPGGIERQEAAGQKALVASTNMPKELHPSKEAFEAIGFVFSDEVDDIFVKATLPAGWTREATDHSMHSDILDEKGRRRVGVFYKAAFYDRRADAHLIPRFATTRVYPERPERDTLLPFIITDCGVEIHRVGGSKYIGDYEKEKELNASAKEWLDTNRPGWSDHVKSWAI